MSDKPLFQNMDEQEAAYAPQELPADQQARVRADEGAYVDNTADTEPPAAAPVAHLGTTPTGQAAPPGVEEDRRDTLRADVGPFGSDSDTGATHGS